MKRLIDLHNNISGNRWHFLFAGHIGSSNYEIKGAIEFVTYQNLYNDIIN